MAKASSKVISESRSARALFFATDAKCLTYGRIPALYLLSRLNIRLQSNAIYLWSMYQFSVHKRRPNDDDPHPHHQAEKKAFSRPNTISSPTLRSSLRWPAFCCFRSNDYCICKYKFIYRTRLMLPARSQPASRQQQCRRAHRSSRWWAPKLTASGANRRLYVSIRAFKYVDSGIDD